MGFWGTLWYPVLYSQTNPNEHWWTDWKKKWKAISSACIILNPESFCIAVFEVQLAVSNYLKRCRCKWVHYCQSSENDWKYWDGYPAIHIPIVGTWQAQSDADWLGCSGEAKQLLLPSFWPKPSWKVTPEGNGTGATWKSSIHAIWLKHYPSILSMNMWIFHCHLWFRNYRTC